MERIFTLQFTPIHLSSIVEIRIDIAWFTCDLSLGILWTIFNNIIRWVRDIASTRQSTFELHTRRVWICSDFYDILTQKQNLFDHLDWWTRWRFKSINEIQTISLDLTTFRSSVLFFQFIIFRKLKSILLFSIHLSRLTALDSWLFLNINSITTTVQNEDKNIFTWNSLCW